jgi:2'-5' RNA ligase
VLWIFVQELEGHLQRLAADVVKRLTVLGWPREKHRITGHLTLARVQRRASHQERRALGESVAGLRGYARVGALPVQRVSIMRSQLRAGGAVYTELAGFTLI